MLIVICVALCALIILSILFFPELKIGKLKLDTYWVIALIGALILILAGYVNIKETCSKMFADTAVNPVKILVLFLSMTGLSVFLDEVGFFRHAAMLAQKRARSSQKALFLYLYITVAVLTVFTSNDIIILTFTPFICYFAKHAGISPIPYLVAEFAAANTWSMALIIGNPTNIYIASSFNIGFFEYMRVMLLPTLAAGLVSFTVLYIIFHKKLMQPVKSDSESTEKQNKPLLIIGLLHLSLCTVILALSSYLNLAMWIVSLSFFISLIICVLIACAIKKEPPVYLLSCIKRLPWQLIPFVLSMFVVVLTLSSHGYTDYICALLKNGQAALNFGFASYLSANIINNIPMSVLFVSVLEPLSGKALQAGLYASIIGSNIGAYLTPIGALAGIMWSSILKKLDVKFAFADFVKHGIIVSVPTITAALLTLMLVL